MTLKGKKRYFIIGFVALALVLVFFAKSKHKARLSEFVLQKQDLRDELLLAGTIDAKKRADLAFAGSGRIKKVHVAEGEFVKEGQVIAELEQNYLESNIGLAKASLELTELNARADINSAESNLQNSQKEQEKNSQNIYRNYLNSDLEAYNLDEEPGEQIAPKVTGSYTGSQEGVYLIEVYSSSTDSGYSYRYSGLESGRASAYTEQAAPLGNLGLYIQFDGDTNYRNTEWEIQIPNTRSGSYLAQKNNYELSKLSADRVIDSAQESFNRVSAKTESNISRNQALKNQAQAELNSVYARLGDGKIVAPFDGLVVRNDLAVGESVNAFVPVITLFESEEKELVVNTPEIYINKITEGSLAKVVLDAYPELEFDAVVEEIDILDREVDGVPVYETKISIKELDSRIRSGMNAKVSVISDQKDAALALPRHYIINEDSGSFILRQTRDIPQEYEKIPAELGFVSNSGLIEIIADVSEGDIILLAEK